MQPPPPQPPPSPPEDEDTLDNLFEERGSRLSSLPPELQNVIKSPVRVFRARKLCNEISTVEAPPLFLSLVRRFIGEAEQNELNPHAVYDPGSNSNTCLQFVENRCMRVASKMYSLVDIRDLASVPPELDQLRELMIQQLAIRRNNKNNQALTTLVGNSTVEDLFY
jgi:hypothetical protein